MTFPDPPLREAIALALIDAVDSKTSLPFPFPPLIDFGARLIFELDSLVSELKPSWRILGLDTGDNALLGVVFPFLDAEDALDLLDPVEELGVLGFDEFADSDTRQAFNCFSRFCN